MSSHYLHFIQAQNRQGKCFLPPWATSEELLLDVIKTHFSDVPLVATEQLAKPNIEPVVISALSPNQFDLENMPELFIAVGGPPAATVALEMALRNKKVLYVSDATMCPGNKIAKPIWAGAGNHGEADALTESPAYTSGYQPFPFIVKEMFRSLLNSDDPTSLDYPWLNLNLGEWLKNPKQWLSALRVAIGNHRLAKKFLAEIKQNKQPEILSIMQQRTRASGNYLEQLNHRLEHKFLRPPRGSLIIAYSIQEWERLKLNQEKLRLEGLVLKEISLSEAKLKYGVDPDNAIGCMEKTHDFIFEPDFLNQILSVIQKNGGEVITHWRLSKIWVDPNYNGGVLEFFELDEKNQRKFHYRRFNKAHLSLGATRFKPNIYDLVSVTGVSINALLVGKALTGGPIVCGGTNHIVPLCDPKQVKLLNPQTGDTEVQDVTLVRLSAAGCVSPLDRGDRWYDYNSNHALHLLSRAQATLGTDAQLQVLSVHGCNRVIGKDGHQVEIHPVISVNGNKTEFKSITIQIGAGGGGLTQMGFVPSQIAP
jgi:hypothetical protein